jgi:hypothetical protein
MNVPTPMPSLRTLVLLVLPIAVACRGEPAALPGPYGAEVAKAIPQVEKVSGLRFKTPPKVETRSRDELRAFLEAKFNEEQPALEMAGEERAYKLFGLLPDTIKLRPFLLSLLAEQVVGYYDPATRVLYVVRGGSGSKEPPPEVLAVTITHELAHALQDQYLPLDSLSKLHGDNDRTMAAQAVIEGGATYDQLSVMLGGGNMFARMPGGWDRVRQMIRDSQGTMPVFATAPMFIQETLLFPYLSGAEFIRQFREKRQGESPLTRLPASTEQVMHPGKLLDTLDAPLTVTLPRPDGGSVVYENGLGEFETRLFLHQQLQDVEAASRGAAGWGGDRYMVVNTPQGAGLTWFTAWDSPFDAAEFRSLIAQAVEKRFELKDGSGGKGTTLRWTAKGRTVEVVAATVQGKATVTYTDVPAGANARLIDPAKAKITAAK